MRPSVHLGRVGVTIMRLASLLTRVSLVVVLAALPPVVLFALGPCPVMEEVAPQSISPREPPVEGQHFCRSSATPDIEQWNEIVRVIVDRDPAPDRNKVSLDPDRSGFVLPVLIKDERMGHP